MSGLLRAAICLGIAFVLLSLLLSGDIALFINPHFKWLTAISVILLLTLGVVQLWYLKEKAMHRIGIGGYLLILVPIAVFLIFPSKPLDASIALKKGFTPAAVSSASQGITQGQNSSGNSADQSQDDPYKPIIDAMKKQPVITMTDDTYSDDLNAIYMHPDQVKGKKVRLLGFIYRDDTVPKGEFVIGRFTITCCTADATVTGFLIKAHHPEQFKTNQWFEMEGTIHTYMSQGMETPYIILDSYQPATEPKDPYVY